MADTPFELLLADTSQSPHAPDVLDRRSLPPTALGLDKTAGRYWADPDLTEAVNVALATGQPLLVTGEPGTGKTQLAYFVASYFGLDRNDRFFRLDVKSNTGHEDLTYRFDAVAYLHAANDPRRSSALITKGEFIEQGVLWRAFEADGPCVVLIDEIDKAPQDFPNDLLRVLGEHSFHCKERNRDIGRGERPPPFILVTSNNERRLPEAFLRRCIFHHILLSERLVKKAVAAHCGHPDFPDLSEPVRAAALRRFFDLRARDLGKKPSLGELLVWLTILAAKGFDDRGRLENCALGALPALPALIKDQDDLERLRV